MSIFRDDSLLARISKPGSLGNDEEAWRSVQATPPTTDGPIKDEEDPKLAQLLERIERMAGKTPRPRAETAGEGEAARPKASAASGRLPAAVTDAYIPLAKRTLEEMRITASEVEALTLKFLLARGDAVGRDIAEQIKIPFLLIDGILRQMKTDQTVVYRGANELNDYIYQLTDLGRERARRHAQHCTYFGAAPVSLDDYVESVRQQSLTKQRPKPAELESAFRDILLSKKMLNRLGPAVNSGRGMFLYGSPGNGKSSIAKRISQVFGKHVWIPRALGVDGEVIRIFDPLNHVEAPLPKGEGLLDQGTIDRRWVRIERPTIMVGGELTMSQLEVTQNIHTRICEAPLQMKSNCGTLVIDDFGRQRMRIDELLNRWIVPLEERIDYISLPSGKTIQVPFDQLIVFSTNLEPRDLVDEAFLRRIAYKIEISDPSDAEFRQLFRLVARGLEIEYRDEVIDYLIENHYRKTKRPFRCCHPRDLLSQVRAHCAYLDVPLEMTNEYFDVAVENYFAVM